MKEIAKLGLILLLAALIAGCQIGVERNPDGSLRLDVVMPEDQLEAELRAAIADPAIESVEIEAHNGYLTVAAERERASGSGVDTMTFRLDLSVVNDHLSAEVSQVVVDGFTVSDSRVAHWNERIAANLERAGARRPDSQLQSVEVDPAGVRMIWRIETTRSRSQ